MKALRQLAENDIIARGVTVRIQQVAVHRNYENPSMMPRVKMSRVDRNRIHLGLSCYGLFGTKADQSII
jgi:hypothetical protein